MNTSLPESEYNRRVATVHAELHALLGPQGTSEIALLTHLAVRGVTSVNALMAMLRRFEERTRSACLEKLSDEFDARADKAKTEGPSKDLPGLLMASALCMVESNLAHERYVAMVRGAGSAVSS